MKSFLEFLCVAFLVIGFFKALFQPIKWWAGGKINWWPFVAIGLGWFGLMAVRQWL